MPAFFHVTNVSPRQTGTLPVAVSPAVSPSRKSRRFSISSWKSWRRSWSNAGELSGDEVENWRGRVDSMRPVGGISLSRLQAALPTSVSGRVVAVAHRSNSAVPREQPSVAGPCTHHFGYCCFKSALYRHVTSSWNVPLANIWARN